jgi:hypothetical protein
MIGKGKISEQEIKELKLLYPGTTLLKFTWPRTGDEVIFRLITQPVMRNIQDMLAANRQANRNSLPVDDVHQKIFDSCVMWPKLTLEEKFNLPVGVIPSIAKVIQEKSGYLDYDIMDRILAPDVHTSLIQGFEAWPDITDEERDALMAKWRVPLFKIRVENCVFVVRPMTRTDVKLSAQALDDELALTQAVTLYPQQVDWDSIPAGWVKTLGRTATDLSGWDAEAVISEL